MKVESKCKVCGGIDKFEAPDSGFEARRRGASIADAFPEMPAERQRQLVNHVCPTCQGVADGAHVQP